MITEERQEPQFRRVDISDILAKKGVNDLDAVQITGIVGGVLDPYQPTGEDRKMAYHAFMKPSEFPLPIIHLYCEVPTANTVLMGDLRKSASMLGFSAEQNQPVTVRGIVMHDDQGLPPSIQVQQVQLADYETELRPEDLR